MIKTTYMYCMMFSLQNQSFQIRPKPFIELDNDVLIVFTKWF